MIRTTLRRAASVKQPPAPFVSSRTCRPCGGTGVGETFGVACETCGGTGDAPSQALRQRRRPVEQEPEPPTEGQIEQLARLIDDVHYAHPEHAYASDLIGRTDATEAQVAAAIAALEPLVVPREAPRRRRGVPLRSTEAWIAAFHQSMADLRAVQAADPGGWRR